MHILMFATGQGTIPTINLKELDVILTKNISNSIKVNLSRCLPFWNNNLNNV